MSKPLIIALGGATKLDVERALARASFGDAVQLIRPDYTPQWFHRRLAASLQWVADTPEARLIVQMPPGHAKSEYCKMFAAWGMGVQHDIDVIVASYSPQVAERYTLYARGLLDGDEAPARNYQRIFPGARIGEQNTRKILGMVGQETSLLTCGVRTPVTSYRGEWLIIDDPFKNSSEAYSKTTRDTVWDEYNRTLSTRRKPGRGMRQVLVNTRWHLDDLAGRLLREQPGEWRVLSFPALKEGPPTAEDPREDGEALWPLVADREVLEKMRALDPEGFAALWQQKPIAGGGKIFRQSWIETWDVLPDCDGLWVQSWDCKHGSKKEESSWVAAGLWFFPLDREHAFLVDVVRGQWDTAETLLRFDAQQNDPLWGMASTRLIEAKGDGVALLSQRGEHYQGMTPVQPRGDKLIRARLVTPWWRSRNVFVRGGQPWTPAYIAEMIEFTGADGEVNDQVDMSTQALAWRWYDTRQDQREQEAFARMIGRYT